MTMLCFYLTLRNASLESNMMIQNIFLFDILLMLDIYVDMRISQLNLYNILPEIRIKLKDIKKERNQLSNISLKFQNNTIYGY